MAQGGQSAQMAQMFMMGGMGGMGGVGLGGMGGMGFPGMTNGVENLAGVGGTSIIGTGSSLQNIKNDDSNLATGKRNQKARRTGGNTTKDSKKATNVQAAIQPQN